MASDGMREALRSLNKISDLAHDEDVGEPLDDAIGYANKAIAALSALPAAQPDRVISQHIGWLKQYILSMTADNWIDMRLRAERQLEELSSAISRPEREAANEVPLRLQRHRGSDRRLAPARL